MAKKARKACVICKKEQQEVNFYATNSMMFPDGRINMCKSCIKKELDENDLNSVRRVLRQIDKPFLVKIWNDCVESDKDTFGNYIRTINSLPQYRNLTYEDSDETPTETIGGYTKFVSREDEFEDIEIPTEVKLKWGKGYTNFEYLQLEKLYKDMMTSNDISSPQHRTQLEIYCKVKILLDRAIEEGDVPNIAKLGKQFDDLTKNSGFRGIDRVSGSESAGIRSFGVIFEEVERDGFIMPDEWIPPEIRDRSGRVVATPQDVIDRTILYMANYTRKLFDMEPLIEPPEDTPKIEEDDE